MGLETKTKAGTIQTMFEHEGLEPPDDGVALEIFDAAVRLAEATGAEDAAYELKMAVQLAKEYPYDEVVRILDARISSPTTSEDDASSS